MPDYEHEIDASGLNCPLPILRARKALSNLNSGEVLKIVSTDPGSVNDFQAFVQQTGHQLLESKEEDGRFFFLIKKV